MGGSSSQLETLPQELIPSELLPLVGKIISQKTQHNQTVHAALIKAWFFANLFSFAVLGPNLFLFKFSDQTHIQNPFECLECEWFSISYPSLDL
jgi:hypothetical protein